MSIRLGVLRSLAFVPIIGGGWRQVFPVIAALFLTSGMACKANDRNRQSSASVVDAARSNAVGVWTGRMSTVKMRVVLRADGTGDVQVPKISPDNPVDEWGPATALGQGWKVSEAWSVDSQTVAKVNEWVLQSPDTLLLTTSGIMDGEQLFVKTDRLPSAIATTDTEALRRFERQHCFGRLMSDCLFQSLTDVQADLAAGKTARWAGSFVAADVPVPTTLLVTPNNLELRQRGADGTLIACTLPISVRVGGHPSLTKTRWACASGQLGMDNAEYSVNNDSWTLDADGSGETGEMLSFVRASSPRSVPQVSKDREIRLAKSFTVLCPERSIIKEYVEDFHERFGGDKCSMISDGEVSRVVLLDDDAYPHVRINFANGSTATGYLKRAAIR